MDSMIFVGNATMLLRLGLFTVLTDPNFLHRGQYAYLGWGLVSRRRTNPALRIGELPPVDLVVLSHLHGDHFDRVARRGLDKDTPFVTTPHAARRLEGWGFTTNALRTWQTHTLTRGQERLVVEAMPGIHARGPLNLLLPPVMGTQLTHHAPGREPRRVYISGDTLTGPHLDAIGERHPRIDTGILHLGGTRVLLNTVTMDDRQGVDAMRRVPTTRTLAVHHEDYTAFKSPVTDFVHRAEIAGFSSRVVVPGRGQTIPLFATTDPVGLDAGVDADLA